MMQFQKSLITKIALLVIGVEMIAFGVLGWFYVDRFSTAADRQVRQRLLLVRQLLSESELQINAVARSTLMSDLFGVNYLRGLVIGGNGRIVVSSDPAFLGRSAQQVPDFDPQWLADEAPELIFIPGDNTLTCVMHISDPQGRLLYHSVLTLDTTAINAQKRNITLWGWTASLAFILLSSIGIILLVYRLISRRVGSTLEVLKEVERGDMSLRIPESSQDEMGQLQRGINSMIENLGVLLERHRRNEEELSAILNSISEGIIAIDRQARVVRINANAQALLDGGTAIGEGDLLRNHLPTFDNEQQPSCEVVLREGKRLKSVQFELTDHEGKQRSIEMGCGPVRDTDDAIIGAVLVLRDITERKASEDQLRLAASVFTHAREGIVITDTDGTIVDINEAFCQITGYSHDEVIGRNPRILKSNRHAKDFYAAMWQSLRKQGYWVGEIWNQRKDGEYYAEMLTISAVKDSSGAVRNYVGLFFDITTQKEQQQQLEYIAHYDALTHLPNRVLLADRLHQSMVQAQRRKQPLAVGYLDLDGFKEVNDKYGHEVGDQLLVTLAQRMKASLREEDTIARLGGDEFVAVLIDLGDTGTSHTLLQRLLASVAQPVQIGGVVLKVSASLGVTFYPQAEEVDADQLLRQADQAMYQAKLSGRNRYHLFDTEQDRSLRGYHESVENIRRALIEREFALYYQPQVNMRTGEVIGVEALIRWQHPDRGLVPPDVFLPVIEDHPLSIELGEWVLDAALSQLEAWHAAGLNFSVSVNIGARQLQQGNFAERLEELLAAHPAIRPGDLKLEVLETSALNDITHVSQLMNACDAIGVSFALDDFGTGYSSLTYLKRLPASELKIDRSFVHDMLDDPEDLAILEGVLSLASAFRRSVIAEGVETREQGVMLLQLGCELAQGYGIAKPMPAEKIQHWLETFEPDPVWLGQCPLSRDDLPLLFAGVEHSAWVRGIEEYLHGERLTVPQQDFHQCRFGHWLDSEGETRYGDADRYREIETLHQQAHTLASELLANQSQGEHSMANTKMDELHVLKERMLAELKLLREECAQTQASRTQVQ